MVNHHDGPPLTLHLSKRLEDGLLRGRINASKGPSIKYRSASCASARAKRPAAAVRPRVDGFGGQRSASRPDPNTRARRLDLLSDSAEPPEFTISPHAHDIERGDRKFPIHTLSLWDIPDGRADRLERLPSKSHQTRSTRHQPQTRFDERALSGPIGANNRNQLRVFGRVVIDVPKHWLSVIGHGHGMNRERAVGGMLGRWIGVMGMTQSLESSRGTPPTLGASPPRARAMVVTLWSIMPR